MNFSVTLPDGSHDFRSSKTRVYTHAVVGRDLAGKWHAARWSGDAHNAAKAINSRDLSYATECRVVAVDAETVAKPKPPAKKRYSVKDVNGKKRTTNREGTTHAVVGFSLRRNRDQPMGTHEDGRTIYGYGDWYRVEVLAWFTSEEKAAAYVAKTGDYNNDWQQADPANYQVVPVS